MNINIRIRFRFASKGDFEEVVKLYKQLWEDWELDLERSRCIFERDLELGRKEYIIGYIDSTIIAIGSLLYKEDIKRYKIGILDELVVDKKYRGKGYGKEMLNRIETLARGKGCFAIELHSNKKREDSHRFYETNGYEKRSYHFRKLL